MRAIRFLVILLLLAGVASAEPQRAEMRRSTSRDLMVITKVEVLVATGPDKQEWLSSWRDNSPTVLPFRWSNDYPSVESAVWQVSTDAEAKNVIASGDAGKPPQKGGMGAFSIDFRPIVGSSQQRPLDYWVRVVSYKGEPPVVSARPGRPPIRPVEPPTLVAGQADPRRITRKELAGPPSQPVLISIIAAGPDTHFSELGLHPELLHTMEIEIDLETLEIVGEGSDEDPYLFVVAVYADGTTVVPELEGGNLVFPTSGVRIDSPSQTHENIPGGDAGDKISIPRSTGHFERTIRTLGVEQLANRFGKNLTQTQKRQVRQNTFVGLVVIGMEEDAIPTTETVDQSRDQLVSELDSAFRSILRGVEVPIAGDGEDFELPDLVAAVRERTGEIRERLVESAKTKTLDDLSEYLVIPGFPTLILAPGIANQDDYIGHDTAVFNYDEILEAGTRGLPIDLTLSQNYVNVPRYLQDGRTEEIYYKIKGRIRRR